MKPIAIFYHCLIHSPDGRVKPQDSIPLMLEQMEALVKSGLMDAAGDIFIGCNGDEADEFAIRCLAPVRAVVFLNPNGATEIPTLNSLQEWSSAHPSCHVFYHHMKGVTYSSHRIWADWRRCMERACVWNWRECVQCLEEGYDSCGAHWLTQRKYSVVHSPIWGGNFWWATSQFIATLPRLKDDLPQNRYEAETWIGKGPRLPRVMDFSPHWPLNCKQYL